MASSNRPISWWGKSPAVSRSEARQCARELLRDWPSQQHLAERVQPLRLRLSELEQRLRSQQDAERLLQEFCKRHGQEYQPDDLDMLQQELEERTEALSQNVSEAGERRMEMRRELEQIQQRIRELTARAPVWLAAQDAPASSAIRAESRWKTASR